MTQIRLAKNRQDMEGMSVWNEERNIFDVKEYRKIYNKNEKGFDECLFITTESGEEINLIINDNGMDIYSGIYVMNDKGETTQRII